jgi:23S rRNA (pseudouridine1915-N3)-methyltransferase
LTTPCFASFILTTRCIALPPLSFNLLKSGWLKKMKIKLISITKSEEDYIQKGLAAYLKRLKHYATIEETIIKPPKEKEKDAQLKKEGDLILQKVAREDYLVLLDEGGKQYASAEFAKWIEGQLNAGRKSVCFVIGGAYGFSKDIYERSNEKFSLSRMTLPHQLAKLFFTEQLYRAFTIIKGEKYHHE